MEGEQQISVFFYYASLPDQVKRTEWADRRENILKIVQETIFSNAFSYLFVSLW